MDWFLYDNGLRHERVKSISELKDEVLNLKDIVIKILQKCDTRFHAKCNYLEKKDFSLETKLNHLSQYCRRNNLELSGIPASVEDKDVESTVSSILSDIDVTVAGLDLTRIA